MDTTHDISNGRRVVAALLSIAALALVTTSVTGITGTAHEGVEEDEDELVGIAGSQRIVTNPAGTIEAAFARESYRPDETAELRLFGDVGRLTIRLFHSGPEGIVTRRNDIMFGVEVAARKVVASARHGSVVRIHVGDWPSGLYFARLSARGGRLGFAPFVVAPAATRGAPRRRRHADPHVVRVRRPRRQPGRCGRQLVRRPGSRDDRDVPSVPVAGRPVPLPLLRPAASSAGSTAAASRSTCSATSISTGRPPIDWRRPTG